MIPPQLGVPERSCYRSRVRTRFGAILITVAMLNAAAIALNGCGDACEVTDNAVVVPGTSDDGIRFLDLADEQEVLLAPGIQGGFHVWLHARTEGLCSDAIRLERRLRDEETDSVYVFGRGPAVFRDTGEGTAETTEAITMPVCPDAFAREILGRRLILEVTATDAMDNRADASLVIVPSCGDDERCADLCEP